MKKRQGERWNLKYQEKKGFDNLWVYYIQKDLLKKLYHGPAKPKFGGVSDLAWSPDGWNIAVFFPSHTLLLEVENPTHVHRIQGKDLSWVSKHSVIYFQENRVYSYRLNARKADLFLENAAAPVFLTSP